MWVSGDRDEVVRRISTRSASFVLQDRLRSYVQPRFFCLRRRDRYAELYPEDVDRIFMLCPSFCLGRRAPTFVSEAEMSEWERTGVRGETLCQGIDVIPCDDMRLLGAPWTRGRILCLRLT